MENQGQSNGGVTAGLHETAQTARNLAHTLESSANALDRASRTAESVEQRFERLTNAADQARERVMTAARERPMAALATALAVGFAAGLLTG